MFPALQTAFQHPSRGVPMSQRFSINRRAMLTGVGLTVALPLLEAHSVRSEPAAATDWPQFRGPDRSGISKEVGLPMEWSSTKNVVWKAALPGPGTSSQIVFGGRVYVTSYTGYGVD